MQSIINFLLDIRIVVGEWLEPNLFWIQLVAVVFSGLFLWGIVYIMTKVNYIEGKIEGYIDNLGMANLTKRKSLKGWEQIRTRIMSSDQAEWKLAVSEADKILNEILKMSGYLGGDLTSKLELLKAENLSNLADIKKAHDLASRIISDPASELKKEDAIAALKSYKKSFIELNLLEE